MVATENNTPKRTRLSTRAAVREDFPLYFFREPYTEPYLNEMNAFVQCIREDRAPLLMGADDRVPVVMGKAARLSF